MPDKHLSSQFDSELNSVSSRAMELGGMVEVQIRQAIYALAHLSSEVARDVQAAETRVNQLEVEIDREISSIIARRQPTAGDLRLLMALFPWLLSSGRCRRGDYLAEQTDISLEE